MSDMRSLMEAVAKFSFANPKQKPGDQVRGTEKAKSNGRQHPFKGRLVGAGESTENDQESLEESLLREYRMFVEADPLVANVAAQQTTVANAATKSSNTQQPQQPAAQAQGNQPAQTPQQQQTQQTQQPQQPAQVDAAQMAKTQADLRSNLSQLKNFAQQQEPQLGQINVPKTADAITKDPKKLTPTDAQNLSRLAGVISPALQDRTGINQLTGVVRNKIQGTNK